eukprot:CCRYP_004009-RB/>CCRYP_004009-RB protein AED:0.47 eAED:1.00 QI:0/0/0/1/0/0/2/0/100
MCDFYLHEVLIIAAPAATAPAVTTNFKHFLLLELPETCSVGAVVSLDFALATAGRLLNPKATSAKEKTANARATDFLMVFIIRNTLYIPKDILSTLGFNS